MTDQEHADIFRRLVKELLAVMNSAAAAGLDPKLEIITQTYSSPTPNAPVRSMVFVANASISRTVSL